MTKIHVLPPHLVAKIAAGEVIERPAFVVKELLENALDAHATQITIEIHKGGLEAIIVTDNGEGMDESDLFLAWQRHTTSKIPSDSDLSQIKTLGFRGEALASISSVSNFIIQSRRKNAVGGHLIEVHNGKFMQSKPTGMAPGTHVRVEHLFESFPARHKFLKNKDREWQYIVQIVESYMLAYPKVRFTLKHNNRKIITALAESLESRIKNTLGSDVLDQSFPFQLVDDHFKINGYLGTPQLSFQSQIPSYLIVNNRVVKSKNITLAIKNAYRSLLKVDTTPFFLLLVNLSYDLVDVNVHPRKEEVSFFDEAKLCEKIVTQIVKTAENQNLSFQWTTPKAYTKSFAAEILKSDTVSSLKKFNIKQNLLQIHNLYILVQTKKGFVIVDQHAAHERVLYERFMSNFLDKKSFSKQYTFPTPQKFTLPLSQRVLFVNHKNELKRNGFIFERKGKSYFLTSVPELFKDRNIIQLMQDLLWELEQPNSKNDVDRHTNRLLSFLACRSAVKAGDDLTQDEMKTLLKELSATKSPYTCPHGRPTSFEVSLSDLKTSFGR